MTNKLLIIESDHVERDAMSKVLNSNYETCFAEDIEDAKRYCHKFYPGVIFFNMPFSDIKLLQILKELIKECGKDIPVIVSVSDNSIEFERAVREEGVFYYLIRPLNLQELWDVLDAAFKHRAKNGNIFPSF